MKIDEITEIICLKNAEEIANYIGESPKNISHLVENEGLPAWKRNRQGAWRALNIDLCYWMIGQRNKYLPDTPQNLENEKLKIGNAHFKNLVNS